MRPVLESSFPNLTLLRASAAGFNLNAEYASLNAILGKALSFGNEVEEGAFKSIYLVYGQGQFRVSVSVTNERDMGYRLVMESIEEREGVKRYAGGLLAINRSDDWNVEIVQLDGAAVACSDFFNSIAEFKSLVLIAKEVGERIFDEVV